VRGPKATEVVGIEKSDEHANAHVAALFISSKEGRLLGITFVSCEEGGKGVERP
jgi:hypothetical protein